MRFPHTVRQCFPTHRMGWFWRKRRDREEHRYYLLPGMGRSNRRHRRRMHVAAVVFGVVVSVLFGVAIYFTQRP